MAYSVRPQDEYCHESVKRGPKCFQVSLMIEYGMPSGPGAESEQELRVSYRSCIVIGARMGLLFSNGSVSTCFRK